MSTLYQFDIGIEKVSAWEEHAMEIIRLAQDCKRDDGCLMTTDNFIKMLQTKFTNSHWVIHVREIDG